MNKKINKNIKKANIFFIIIQILIILIIGFLRYISMPFQSEPIIFIPKGSITKIITNLSNNNYQINKLDKYILIILGKPQSGYIDIGHEKNSKIDFLYKLTRSKTPVTNITLIPGETTIIFLKDIAKKLNLNENILIKEYEKQAKHKEGMLNPESYKIPINMSEKELINFLLKNSNDFFKKLSIELLGYFDEKKWHDIIIKASIIQKEAANIDEMPLIASVINNRLKANMKLQMDGTLNYGYYSHTKITPNRIKNDNSDYNTYKIKGLPKDAICNVSIDAIKAVIFPANTNYIYFVRDKKTSKHIFTNKLKEHNKNIKK